jgi:hypothetical protein
MAQDVRNHTKCAAEFLAAGELVARGWDVSFAWGSSAPLFDLMVRAPSGATFVVDVKGKRSAGPWLIKPKPTTANLYYLLVRIGDVLEDDTRVADRFFLLGQTEALALTRHDAVRPGLSGIRPSLLRHAEGAWDVLPR